MKIKKLIQILLSCCLLISCNRPIKLVDYYYVYPDDEYGNGYYLMCKLGHSSDAKVENLKSVKWNERYIIMEQDSNEYTSWYIIKARGDKLMCCNGDTLIGPLTVVEVDVFINKNQISNLKDIPLVRRSL